MGLPLAVVVALVVIDCGIVEVVACVVNALFRAKHQWDISWTVCVFAMGRRNVQFVPTTSGVL